MAAEAWPATDIIARNIFAGRQKNQITVSKVKIVMTDGKVHQFRVTDVNDTSIVGDDVHNRHFHIVALETREFSGGKTAALVGGSTLTFPKPIGCRYCLESHLRKIVYARPLAARSRSIVRFVTINTTRGRRAIE